MAFNYDKWTNIVDGIPYGLYFYLLDSQHMIADNGSNNSEVLGNCPSLQGGYYHPYLTASDVSLLMCPYDTRRFGTTDTQRPTLKNTPDVWRIIDVTNKSKNLGSFTRPTPQLKGGLWDWRKEGKLYNFPYTFGLVTDYLSEPLEIQYHLLSNNTTDIFVKFNLSPKGTYMICLNGYKGDNGKIENSVASGSLDIPLSTSSYSQFMATSKSQFMLNNGLSLLKSIGNIAQGTAKGVTEGVTGIATQLLNNYATLTDLRTTPKTIRSMGNDLLLDLYNSERKLQYLCYRISDDKSERIGKFFHMYGYAQNKTFIPNLRSRKNFNYIEIVRPNISGNIPKKYLDRLKNIYEKGTTIWHVDRFSDVLNYSLDNEEV